MNINNVNKLISGASPNPSDRNKAANLRKDGPSASLQPHVTNKSEIAESKAARIQKQLPDLRPDVIAEATAKLESGEYSTRASAVKTAESILGF